MNSVKYLRISLTGTYSRHFASSTDTSQSYVSKIKLLQNLKEKNGINESLLANADFLVFDKNRPLISSRALAWVKRDDIDLHVNDVKENAVLIGVRDEGTLQLAIHQTSLDEQTKENLQSKYKAKFQDLRFAMLALHIEDVKIVSKGNSLLNWHRKSGFCSNCGNRTSRNLAGSQRTCSSCGMVHYPTTNPVGITLVTNKDYSKVLLVRQPRHPPGMYTCIAGFVDAGETVEDSIRREVAEEVGLDVCNVEYEASQHWPFPISNLMIGCRAIVTDDSVSLDVDRSELEGARWFPREEIAAAVESINRNPLQRVMSSSTELFVPPKGTVAHTLITNWLEKTKTV